MANIQTVICLPDKSKLEESNLGIASLTNDRIKTTPNGRDQWVKTHKQMALNAQKCKAPHMYLKNNCKNNLSSC